MLRRALSFAIRLARIVRRGGGCFPIFDALRTNSDFEFSNKIAGIDLRWRMPGWRGFDMYAEGDFDDRDPRRFRSSFLQDAGYRAGISLACLGECGRFGVRAEYRRTGIRYYTHGDYPIRQNGFLLADPLGPRGLGAYLMFDGDAGAVGHLSLEGAFEVRSRNTYGAETTGPHAAGFHVVQVLHRRGEKRMRVVTSWIGSEGARLSLRVSAGMEHVSDFGFIAASDRTNGLARVGLVAGP